MREKLENTVSRISLSRSSDQSMTTCGASQWQCMLLSGAGHQKQVNTQSDSQTCLSHAHLIHSRKFGNLGVGENLPGFQWQDHKSLTPYA